MGNLGVDGPVHRDGLLVVEPVHDNDDKAVIAQGPGPYLSTFKPVHDNDDKAVMTQGPSQYLSIHLIKLVHDNDDKAAITKLYSEFVHQC